MGKDEISDSEEEPQTAAYAGHAHACTHAHAWRAAHRQGGGVRGNETVGNYLAATGMFPANLRREENLGCDSSSGAWTYGPKTPAAIIIYI